MTSNSVAGSSFLRLASHLVSLVQAKHYSCIRSGLYARSVTSISIGVRCADLYFVAHYGKLFMYKQMRDITYLPTSIDKYVAYKI